MIMSIYIKISHGCSVIIPPLEKSRAHCRDSADVLSTFPLLVHSSTHTTTVLYTPNKQRPKNIQCKLSIKRLLKLLSDFHENTRSCSTEQKTCLSDPRRTTKPFLHRRTISAKKTVGLCLALQQLFTFH